MMLIPETQHPFTGGDSPDYWFLGRADDAMTLEPLDRISQVDDKSGHNISVTQPLLAQQPFWTGNINGKTVPSFQTPGAALAAAGTVFPLSDFTIMFVASTDLSGEGRIIVQRAATTLFDIHFEPNGELRVFDGSNIQITPSGIITADVPFLATIVLEQNQPNGKIIVDGNIEVSGFTYLPTGLGGVLSIGKFVNNIFGEIAEILVWKKVLPDHKINFYQQYLRNTYATL